ncbi:hypothetical protein AX15_006547 [Amanita polypyramis BW_CC]|nr:hypothetical protein AX15_006547 [Amanita polypyramis BW_CC]
MTRLPPALSYLTIYNPTLRPIHPAPDGDEDAEAQAHILFYTSKEKAVSRDRMLRQVGLAKALVNFAELFSSQDLCDSVHSQARRMVMFSPEPDYWIHAGIEVAKSRRTVPDKGKGKARDKTKSTSRTPDDSVPAFEYHDSSVQDGAIRSILLYGYEQFKLTHGSFSQILSTLGQEALELQLERFFTVWAWSLSLEEIPEFGEHLGIPLHPHRQRIVKLLDPFEEDLNHVSVFAQPPHVVTSSNYFTHRYPLSLLRHLLSLTPGSLSTSSSLNPPTGGVRSYSPKQDVTLQNQTTNNVDGKKWYWPSYLTFGGRAPPKPNRIATEAKENQEAEPGVDRPQLSDVDKSALEDAISTVNISASTESENATKTRSVSDSTAQEEPDDRAKMNVKSTVRLQRIFIHLPDPTNHLLTRQKEISYFIDNGHLLAVIPPEEGIATEMNLTARAEAFFNGLEQIFSENELLSTIDQLPSAAKILQPLDQHILAKEGLILSNLPFSSRSLQLYETKAILDLEPETSEVFSRGQNPQHWYVAKRGLGAAAGNVVSDGEVYLEVFRKESSLTDVDNALVGIVRKGDL